MFLKHNSERKMFHINHFVEELLCRAAMKDPPARNMQVLETTAILQHSSLPVRYYPSYRKIKHRNAHIIDIHEGNHLFCTYVYINI